MSKNLDTFYPNHFYHIYNRTNNREQLFTQARNYRYFLEKYTQYLHPVVGTYAYCLLGNHFHFLAKVKSEAAFNQFVMEGQGKGETCHEIVSSQFRKFFITYSKVFNKQEGRYGNLLQRPFKRVQISSEEKFANIVFYIHANPSLHNSAIDFKSYKWSSYLTFLSAKPTKIERKEVLEWFGGVKYFLNFHDESHEFRNRTWVVE